MLNDISIDMILLTFLLVVVITLFITKWVSIEITSLFIPPVLVLTGILEVKDALSGFSSSATITIAALFVISEGLRRTEFLLDTVVFLP